MAQSKETKQQYLHYIKQKTVFEFPGDLEEGLGVVLVVAFVILIERIAQSLTQDLSSEQEKYLRYTVKVKSFKIKLHFLD